MAIWQVPIELVPAKWAEEHKFETDLLYGEYGFDTTCAWIENQPTKNLDAVFSLILPKAESWSEDLLVWGSDKQHDISVCHGDGIIFSIGFRLDLRGNVTSLISALCDAAISLSCVLFVPGQKVMFKPNMFELKRYILNSNAARFVQDPERFLNDL